MKDEELKTMRTSFQTLFNRRKQLLNDSKIKKLQEKVLNIKKLSIENNRELLKIATESFKNNDLDYYFAKNADEANDIIFKIITEENNKNKPNPNFKIAEYHDLGFDNKIAKSKSNTLGEIGVSKFLKSQNIEVIETDLGDRILQLKKTDNKPSHPTGPASHLNVEQIAKIVNDSLKLNIDSNPKAIMEAVKSDVFKRLATCEIGITGANAIASEEGSIVLIHNEGNISLISLMKTHIIVAGIDKFVPSLEDAVSIAKLTSVYATGNLTTSYMNIISGPSKTADIEKKLLKNMYGAGKVVVVILDNGRSEVVLGDVSSEVVWGDVSSEVVWGDVSSEVVWGDGSSVATQECLNCIGCGSCIVTCPVYNAVGNEFGFKSYLGGRGIAISSFIEDEETSFNSGLFMCTLCGLCTINCPVAMPTNILIEKIRFDSQKQGFYPRTHGNIKDNIEKKGSPY